MHQPPIELWGGIECTVNRVGDAYHDQLSFSGHRERATDLWALGSLGLKPARANQFPVSRICGLIFP